MKETVELIAIVWRLASLREGLENGNSAAEHAAVELASQAQALMEKISENKA